MNRRGFTLVELLATVAILGLLASIALPKYQYLRKKAVAVDVMAAMVAVRTAAFNYNGTTGQWPATAGLGVVPGGLGPYLPGGLSFRTANYRLRWRQVSVGRGPTRSTYQVLLARFTDGQLCQGVAGLWGGSANAAIVPVCTARGGTVTLFVDN